MAILVFSPNGTYKTKSTLEEARTSADCTGKTVVVTSALTAAQSDITAAWPTDRALEVKKGGSIANTTAFIINGSFTAGLYQVFAGSGAVTGLKEARPEWFGPTPSAGINEAINSGGVVKLSSASYTITTAIIVKNNTKIIGAGIDSTFINHTYSTGNTSAITDSTTRTVSVNNVVVKGFTLTGDSFSQATGTIGILFSNINNSLVEDVKIGGFSSTGLRLSWTVDDVLGDWHGSHNNKANRVIVDGTRFGDAFQFTGHDTTFMSCTGRNFGDTGFAVVSDAYGISPAGLATNTTYINCTVDGIGSSGRAIVSQAGFAFGPHPVGHKSDIKLTNCVVRNCHVGLWAICFNGLTITDCYFYSHTASDTGNVRLDDITSFSISGGCILGSSTVAPTGDASCILLTSDRLTYGASIFDGTISNGFVGGGISLASDVHTAIRLTVGSPVTLPTFTPVMTHLHFSGIFFNGTSTGIYFAPTIGNPSMFQFITVSSCSKLGGAFLAAIGNDNTYSNIFFSSNSFSAGTTNLTAGISPYGIFYDFGLYIGTAAPAIAPRCINDNYLDVAAGTFYKSIGTVDSTQWKVI